MRRTLLFVLMFGSAVCHAATENFVACNVLDPEFHDDLDMMVYQHIVVTPGLPDSQESNLVRVNPVTGLLQLSTDGVLATDLTPYPLSQAGPKFSNGENPAGSGTKERFIAYSQLLNPGGAERHVAGIREHNVGAVGCTTPGSDADTCFPDDTAWKGRIPTTLDTNERWTVYTTEEEYLTYKAKAVYHYDPAATVAWADVNDFINNGTGTETVYVNDSDIGWARMEELALPGGSKSLQIVASWIPSGTLAPVPQVFLIDAVTNVATQITTTNTLKFNPFLFQNAADGANMIVFRDQVIGMQTDIVILKQASLGSSTWNEFLRITPQSIGEAPARPWLLSPEPFTYDNDGSGPDDPVTYILFSSADDKRIIDQEDGNIWVAKVKSSVSAVKLNDSGAASHTRVEAEVYFPNNNAAPLFYYQRGVTTEGENNCHLYPGFLKNQALFYVTGVTLPT